MKNIIDIYINNVHYELGKDSTLMNNIRPQRTIKKHELSIATFNPYSEKLYVNKSGSYFGNNVVIGTILDFDALCFDLHGTDSAQITTSNAGDYGLTLGTVEDWLKHANVIVS